jgi:hypothetical protein
MSHSFTAKNQTDPEQPFLRKKLGSRRRRERGTLFAVDRCRLFPVRRLVFPGSMPFITGV